MSEQFEKIYFRSQAQQEREIIEDEMKESRSGIVFREEVDPKTGKTRRYIYIGNPYEERPLIIKLETYATKEEIEAIKREIIPMKESFEILTAMAQAYHLRQPLLIEGPTAIGKTFLANKFTELLYGRGVKPLDFYCSGQTDVSELMAKWVPKVQRPEERKKWDKFLESLEGQRELLKITQEIEQAQGLSQDQKLELIQARLRELAKSIGLSPNTQWELQYGAVPKAMGLIRNPDGSFSFDEEKGDGFILHIQEVGLAEPSVVNALLKIRGESGQLAREIQLWENGGRKIKAGPRFWVLFTTNPPEEYPDRNEVDPALARAVFFLRMGELSEESLQLAAEYIFTYQVGDRPEEKPDFGCILDIYNHPKIGKQVAEVVAIFHSAFANALKQGEIGRQQRIPLTLDDMFRVAQALIWHQIPDKETDRLDLAETLRRHIETYYIQRLADEDLKQKMRKVLEELLTGDTGKIKFRGKILTRKEVFDILVEEASMTEEEKARLEAEEKERIMRESQRFRREIEAATGRLRENPDIPDDIREKIKKKS